MNLYTGKKGRGPAETAGAEARPTGPQVTADAPPDTRTDNVPIPDDVVMLQYVGPHCSAVVGGIGRVDRGCVYSVRGLAKAAAFTLGTPPWFIAHTATDAKKIEADVRKLKAADT